MLLLDFHVYNPTTERFDRLPPDGSVLKGNICPGADPSRPFWDLVEPLENIDDEPLQNVHDEPLPHDGPPLEHMPSTFWRDMAHTLWVELPPFSADSAPSTAEYRNIYGDSNGRTTCFDDLIEPQCVSPKELCRDTPGHVENDSTSPDEELFGFGEPPPFEDEDEEGTTALSPPTLKANEELFRLDEQPPFEDEESSMAPTPSTLGAAEELLRIVDDEDLPASTPFTPEAADNSPGEWEAFKIIDEEVIDDETHYMVAWKPTLEPESNLGHLAELIAE